jgi:hypothetical protein
MCASLERGKWFLFISGKSITTFDCNPILLYCMLVAWLSELYSEISERTNANWENDSQLRHSFPGLFVFANAMFGERTGRAFWRALGRKRFCLNRVRCSKLIFG